eukprot:GHVO01020054.1.p1 GENE.GHVO01020054.1~~GHVO01020054.1.p1  ORF type:complete len:225 (+),score=17.14 GHVO01020054.1:408-1082(+)
MGARLVIGFSNAIGVHARLSIIQSITQYQTSVEMKFATLIGLVASVVHGASQDQITPNSMKQMLMDASQGANLEQFAHKLLAFTDRQERVFADSTCGTGMPVTQFYMVSQEDAGCEVTCQDVHATHCLEGPTVAISQDVNSCACALNVVEGVFPVPVVSEPSQPTGCISAIVNGYSVFNQPEVGHPHQKSPNYSCSAPAIGTGARRWCACAAHDYRMGSEESPE